MLPIKKSKKIRKYKWNYLLMIIIIIGKSRDYDKEELISHNLLYLVIYLN